MTDRQVPESRNPARINPSHIRGRERFWAVLLTPAQRDFRLLAHESQGAILVLYQSDGGSQETGGRNDRRSCLWFV